MFVGSGFAVILMMLGVGLGIGGVLVFMSGSDGEEHGVAIAGAVGVLLGVAIILGSAARLDYLDRVDALPVATESLR